MITASAVGGAAVTTLWNVVDRLLERRHQHDETRRERYVAIVATIDELHQGLVDAITAHNRFVALLNEAPPRRQALQEARDAADARVRAVGPLYGNARLAMHTVALFAPSAIVEPIDRLVDAMYQALAAVPRNAREGPTKVPQFVFPSDDWTALRDAIRRDLGVPKLRVGTQTEEALEL